MPFSHTLDDADQRPSGPADLLPAGWYHLPIPDVDRTVVVGPGGVWLLVTRSASVVPIDRVRNEPWNGIERRRATSARVTADLVSQLLSTLCDATITVRPVVVLDNDDRRLVARVDDVAVLHRHRLAAWLGRQPRHLDGSTVADIVLTVTATRPLHSI